MKGKLLLSLVYLLLIGGTHLLVSTKAFGQQSKRSEGRPVASSTEESASFINDYAVDGNTSTKWSSQSGNYNQWFDVDLGTQYDISQVVIRWADGRYATHLDIQVRNTTSEPWVTIRTIANNTSSSVNYIRGLKSNSRFVRFNGRGRANPAGYRIAEFEVYGYPVIVNTTAQKDIDSLTNRLKRFHVANMVGSTDDVPASSITSFMSLIDSTGRMTDLSYAPNGTWRTHTSRMKLMAVAYRNPASPHYNSVVLRNKIRVGLYFYYLNSPYIDTSNWYNVKISGPEANMTAIILMKGAIPVDSLRACASAIIDYTVEEGHKGQNRTWVSMAPIHRGCIEDRFYWVDKGYKSIVTALDLVYGANEEGIKVDNSFHQHNAQIQIGSYGKSLLEDQVDYMHLSYGTQFENVYDNARRATISKMMLNSLMVLSYKNQVDYGVVGRALSGHNGTINIPTKVLDKMMVSQPDSASTYQNWKNHINGTGPFPNGYKLATHFWKSDILSYRGANYYLSAKVISNRTYGAEMLNNENLKCANLPMGATNIMSTGDEYRNIFPVWNWSRVPGTTAELNDAATLPDSSYIKGKNAFAGGMSHGDDGILSYDHNYRSIIAKKSYFFINNMMLCLGAGITANKSNPILTSVNQTTLVGDVSYNNGSTQTLGTTPLTGSNINWAYHNNVGYIFPLGGNLTVQKASQSGSWRLLKLSGSTASQSRNVFSAWFNHGNTPSNGSYCYIIAPGKSLSDMPALSSSHGFVVVQNTAFIQAIRNDNGSLGKWAVVFHQPGTVDMGNGMTITSDKKVIVLIKEYSGNYRISVSDPLYNQSSVALKINKQVEGGAYANGFTTLNISFNTGDSRGKVKTGFFNKIQMGGLMSLKKTSLELTNLENVDRTDPEIVIYPNPANEIINIDGVKDGATIEIYGINGRKLITTTNRQVNISHLLAGSYVIRINSNGVITSRVFIKK